MHAHLEDFKTGRFGLFLTLSASEIDELIEALKLLKRDPEWHFHFRSSFEEHGIGDIEISNGGDEDFPYLKLETGEVIWPDD